MASSSLWQRFQQYFLRYDDLGFSIDISRMKFPDGFFDQMRPKVEKAFSAMRDLEAGGIANPDEKRMVGHYWLRKPALAPNPELRSRLKRQTRSSNNLPPTFMPENQKRARRKISTRARSGLGIGARTAIHRRSAWDSEGPDGHLFLR
jgi:glucose-6-phosphate isomerase